MKYTIIAMLALLNYASNAQEISTGKSTLLATNTPVVSKTRTEKVKVVIPSNVEYPAILEDHIEESKEYIEDFSKNRRDYIIKITNKGKKLLPKVAAVLKKFNLPQEFKVLIALESGFNPTAKSGAGAFGYWQFMDGVAKEYGLNIVSAKDTAAIRLKKNDDRSNFQKSTNAAARYLRDRSRNLNNDWLLIVASYNYGIGNVREAMTKSGKANPTFWDIKRFLPAETRNYVMNFIAMNVVSHNYDKFLKNNLQFSDKEVEQLVNIPVVEESLVN